MQTHYFENGPCLRGVSVILPHWIKPSTVLFCEGNKQLANLDPQSEESHEITQEKENILRMTCGLKRAKSVPRVTIYSAQVTKGLIESLSPEPATTGILVVTTTAASNASCVFEARGLAEGWGLVDPNALPQTISSFIPTRIAMGFGLRAFALTFLHGPLGVLESLEYAHMALADDRAKQIIVVAADECADLQKECLGKLGKMENVHEGAAALFLENRNASKSWQLCFLAKGNDLKTERDIIKSSIPGKIFSVNTKDSFYSMTSMIPISTLLNAVIEEKEHATLLVEVPGHGWRAAGFRKLK